MAKKQESPFYNQVILITGGTGSFGRAFVEYLIKEDACSKVIVFSRDEWKQWEMKRSAPWFSHPKVRYFLGDVRDKERLCLAFREVNLVVHAAALKQVPAAEYNPSECIKTNVFGAENVIQAALDARVEKVVSLSTDKAVNPVNLYGASKLCADKLFVSANVYAGARGSPKFSVVRYGNVLGSRGSIIPFWRQLLREEKPLPVTDPRMTRFWITLPQAIKLVVDAFKFMRGAEIFVPKIPSMKILDLARALSPDAKHEFVGIREGEKLHELLISQEDARHTLELEDHYVIVPEIFLDQPEVLQRFLSGRKGKPPPEDFAYTSDGNVSWLSVEDIQTWLSGIEDGGR